MKLLMIALLACMVVGPALTDHLWSNPVEPLGNNDPNKPVPFKDDNADSKLSLRRIKELLIEGSIRRKFAAAAIIMRPGKNMICSPFSALLPLESLLLGAEGASFEELKNAIGKARNINLSKMLNAVLPEVTLNIASMVYVSDKIVLNDKYVTRVNIFNNMLKKTNISMNTVQQLNFNSGLKAAAIINAWISKGTHEKIIDSISPTQINPSTTIVLVNAIYFRGIWLTPFPTASDETFFGRGGVKSTVRMMHSQNNYKYAFSEELQAKIIEIPYKGEAVSLIVVLPLERDGLAIVLHKIKLAPELLDASLKDLTKRKVSLHLPVFKIETSVDLIPLYQSCGLTKIFKREDSGLTGISQDKNSKISVGGAVQKVMIEVTKGKTLANAHESIPTETGPSFHANHPFYFFVTAWSEQLFSGSFYNDDGKK